MSDAFLGYLRSERARLGRALSRALVDGADEGEVVSLRRQRRIVDDQLARWSRDLREEALAA